MGILALIYFHFKVSPTGKKKKDYWQRYTAVYGSPEINVVMQFLVVLCFCFSLHWNRPICSLIQLFFFSQCFLPEIVILHLEKKSTLHSSVNTIVVLISCVADCLTEPSLMPYRAKFNAFLIKKDPNQTVQCYFAKLSNCSSSYFHSSPC